MLVDYIEELIESNRIQSCLCGWVELMGDKYEALMCLVENKKSARNFTADAMKQIIEHY